MKVRSTVIFACMIVVPAIALFSHRLPAEFRSAVRTHLWAPLETWATSLAERGAVAPTEALVEQAVTEPQAQQESAPVPEPGSMRIASSPMAPPAASATPASRSNLTALGGRSIDCRPFDGLAGTHVASCRVAVDATGQLHRVFQSVGRTPDEAVASLEEAVRAWQSRRAATAPQASAAKQF